MNTVIEKDKIPAIFEPQFKKADQAVYSPENPCLGLVEGEEARAYSLYLLNSHEIVNDEIGGKHYAVTW